MDTIGGKIGAAFFCCKLGDGLMNCPIEARHFGKRRESWPGPPWWPEHPLSFLLEEQINILTPISLINSCNRVSINTKRSQTERKRATERNKERERDLCKRRQGKNKWLQVCFRALKIINGLCPNFKLLHLHVFTSAAFWTTLGINEK